MVVQLYRTKRRGPVPSVPNRYGYSVLPVRRTKSDQVPQPNDRQAGSVVQISLKHIADLPVKRWSPWVHMVNRPAVKNRAPSTLLSNERNTVPPIPMQRPARMLDARILSSFMSVSFQRLPRYVLPKRRSSQPPRRQGPE